MTTVLRRVETLPGVESAAIVNGLPLAGVIHPFGMIIEASPTTHATATGRVVSPNYFRVMRIPLKSGRLLTENDTAASSRGCSPAFCMM